MPSETWYARLMSTTYVYIGVLVLLLGVGLYAYDSGSRTATNDINDSSTDSVPETTGETTIQQQEITPLGQKALDLSGQSLMKVPGYVFERTDLEVLNLSHNTLSGALPGEIRLLTKLTALDLSDNNFTGVPAEIGQLRQLEYLDLSGNALTGLPYELGDLSNLKVLDLRNTNYSTHDLDIIREKLPKTTEVRV